MARSETFAPLYRFERHGSQLRLTSAHGQAVIDLRGFMALIGTSWLSMLCAVGFLYRSASSDEYFVLGVATLIAACALWSWAQRSLASRVKAQWVAVGMTEGGATDRTEEVLFQLWRMGDSRGARGRDRFSGLLEDIR